jgi:hypothetical protein
MIIYSAKPLSDGITVVSCNKRPFEWKGDHSLLRACGRVRWQYLLYYEK